VSDGGRYLVYALLDPRDYSLRYVGVTTNALDRRLYFHCRHAEKNISDEWKARWIRELQELSMVPFIQLLERTSNPRRERDWILHLKQQGHQLMNTQDGVG
jgi:hypothetical protein